VNTKAIPVLMPMRPGGAISGTGAPILSGGRQPPRRTADREQ